MWKLLRHLFHLGRDPEIESKLRTKLAARGPQLEDEGDKYLEDKLRSIE